MQTKPLAGRKFFSCNHNGVVAVASADTETNLARKNWVLGRINQRYYAAATAALSHLNGPIFTFASEDRAKGTAWFTGNMEFFAALSEYILAEGGILTSSQLYVPFSNGHETGSHGEGTLVAELAYVTSEEEFEAEFGIPRFELYRRMVEVERAKDREIADQMNADRANNSR